MKIQDRLSTFKKLAFENSVRLFEDAVDLFHKGSYPSAFFLAVASFEELGKVHVIDRGCDMICMNPESFDQLYEMYFKGSWLSDHLHKQRQALFDAVGIIPTEEDPLWRWINSAGLEKERQNALYVEMEGDRIQTPQRITKEKALMVLKLCLDGLDGTGDLAFNGFGAYTSNKSEWLAQRTLDHVRELYGTCTSA